MDGVKYENICKRENSKGIVMDEVNIGKSGNRITLISMAERNREEEELCKLIIKGLAWFHRERHALLATAEEENQRVQCIDDITGEELP